MKTDRLVALAIMALFIAGGLWVYHDFKRNEAFAEHCQKDLHGTTYFHALGGRCVKEEVLEQQ